MNFAVEVAEDAGEIDGEATGRVVAEPPLLLQAVPLRATVATRTGRINFFTCEALFETKWGGC